MGLAPSITARNIKHKEKTPLRTFSPRTLHLYVVLQHLVTMDAVNMLYIRETLWHTACIKLYINLCICIT